MKVHVHIQYVEPVCVLVDMRMKLFEGKQGGGDVEMQLSIQCFIVNNSVS